MSLKFFGERGGSASVFSLRRTLALASAFAITASTSEVFGQQVAMEVKDFTIYQPYVSPRALGMGNAFTAVADDYSAIFYNPAGLARLEEGEINLGLSATMDSKIQKLYSDIDSASKTGQTDDIRKVLEENYGNHYSARASLLNAFWARPRWGLAIIPVDLSVEMDIHQLAGASLNMIATQDTTIAYGRGWDVKWFDKDRMSLGITGKAIYRGYFNKTFLASDLVFDSKLLRPEDAAEGFTADLDFGALYTPHVGEKSLLRFFKPTLGFTVRNIVDYGFTTNFHLIDKNSKQPPPLGRRFDVGSMFELPDFWIFKTRMAADLRDIGHENWTFKKGSHLGFEFLWKVRSWWQGGWRVGLNQGYFTAGFTGKLGIFNLDLVTYAEEVGPSDQPKANRRYMAKTSLDW